MDSLAPGTRIAATSAQVSCDLGGEAAILNLKTGVYFGLDPVGAELWRRLKEPTTFAALCDAMMSEYEVDRERLAADLTILLKKLAANGLVEFPPA